MTNRCRILIIISITGLVLGILREQNSLTILSLSILVWLFLGWLHFRVRIERCWPRLCLIRKINGHPNRHATLWSERSTTVSVALSATSGKIPCYVVVRDILPHNMMIQSGHTTIRLIDDATTVELEYSGRTVSAGRIEFFGVHLCFQDPQGLYVCERVFRDGSKFRVLPSFSQIKDARSHIKRSNSIPQHGIHRLRNAGLGCELLELREYRAGDPPKSIAWKVSARRGELMIRQYESEVPIRVTVFLDGRSSNTHPDSQSKGLNQLASIAATVSKTAISVGDSIGLVLLKNAQAIRLRPATGDRAFYRILDSLADFSSPDSPSVDRLPARTLHHMLLIFEERYPELFESRLLTRRFSILPLRPTRRRQLRNRRRLSAVLAELYCLTATQQIELTFDDQAMAKLVQQWARESQIPIPIKANQNEDEEETKSRLVSLSRELTRAIAFAKDNELFVIIADLLNDRAHLEPLVSAARLAVAKHHRVVFVCRGPEGSRAETPAADTRLLTVDDVYRQAQYADLTERMEELRHHLRSTGGRVALVDDHNLVSTLMAEAELAGSGRFLGASN